VHAVISKYFRRLWRIAAISAALMVGATSHAGCNGTLFLTFDTGHMEPASAIADILAKHQIKATFFLANEKTKSGGWALDDEQKPFWQRLAREGHAFGSHTWNHHYFRGDVGVDQVRLIPWGQAADKGRTLDAAGVCEEIKKPDTRFREMTGRNFDPIWRAPGGKTSPRYTAMVAACGYRHVGWADAGFLGDELSSKTHPNEALIKRAVAGLRDGDVMMAHLGIWSREEPFWPALDPLIGALKAKGFCFATIAEQSKRADTAGKGR
jgi:peptidoglycan/xylan/chitin deacetylase (PgdA/CDA1 family)